MSSSPLFQRYISNFTIGELPKVEREEYPAVELTPDRYRELGYVQTEDGSWAHESECAMLPKGGKLRWVKMN